MEKNKLLTLVITLTVGIILAGSLLVPVVDDYSSTYKDVKNNASGYMADAFTSPGTLVVDTTSGSTVVTWDGESIGVTTGVYSISDKFVVYGSNGTTRYSDVDGAVSNISPATTITVTFSDNSATVEYGEINKSFDLSWAFIRTGSNGPYIAYSPAATTFDHYLNSMDQLWGSNWIDTTSQWFSYHGSNVLVDGEPVTAEYTLNKVSGYEDLYTLKIGGGAASEYGFIVDNDGTDYTVHPRFTVVPAQITAVKEGSTGILSLLGAIPLLFIVSLIVVAAGALYLKRDD